MKYLYILLGAFCLSACNVAEVGDVEEDYAKIFPEKGIEKPEVSSSEIIELQGDPQVTKATFKYEGREVKEEVTHYTVTLKYRLREDREDLGKSRYFLRFVDEKKQLLSLFSNATTNFTPYDEYSPDAPVDPSRPAMHSNREYTVRFQAQSGFQLFLCVTGAGPRNSSIRASLTAVDNDGLLEPIVLQTEQYQDSEGQASLPFPYCKYIILP